MIVASRRRVRKCCAPAALRKALAVDRWPMGIKATHKVLDTIADRTS
jgi:hypothetical protein